jgi:hypothetical protein
MATFLDVSGISNFSNIFVFIFVWLITYAVLMYSKVLGGNKVIHAIIGFVIAILVLISPVATGVIAYIAPWFGIIFLFMIFIGVIMKSFGATGADMATYAPLKTVFFVIIVAVIVIGAANYVRENTGIAETQDNLESGDYDVTKTSNVLLHPKIIGAIFVFLIAIFTIALLVGFNK